MKEAFSSPFPIWFLSNTFYPLRQLDNMKIYLKFRKRGTDNLVCRQGHSYLYGVARFLLTLKIPFWILSCHQLCKNEAPTGHLKIINCRAKNDNEPIQKIRQCQCWTLFICLVMWIILPSNNGEIWIYLWIPLLSGLHGRVSLSDPSSSSSLGRQVSLKLFLREQSPRNLGLTQTV